MIGDVLILLAAIILVSFASFNIGRNLANEGTIENQVLAGDFANLEMETYNDKILSGRDVIEFMKKNDNMTILVNTAKIRVNYPLSSTKDLPNLDEIIQEVEESEDPNVDLYSSRYAEDWEDSND